MKNEVMEKGRKSTEKVFTTLLVDGRLLESEPSSQVSLSPLLLPTATTMGQFFWSNQQQTHSHLIFSEGVQSTFSDQLTLSPIWWYIDLDLKQGHENHPTRKELSLREAPRKDQ
uniref:Uncharacterized protein n=1 Tax=Daphnia galeata TaxID=27404 RepID=A0A8J2S141_9CRUS|nr:unnamed protein product [Daphnia galeata]